MLIQTGDRYVYLIQYQIPVLKGDKYCIQKVKYWIVIVKILNIYKIYLIATGTSLYEGCSLSISVISEDDSAKFSKIRPLGGRQCHYK